MSVEGHFQNKQFRRKRNGSHTELFMRWANWSMAQTRPRPTPLSEACINPLMIAEMIGMVGMAGMYDLGWFMHS